LPVLAALVIAPVVLASQAQVKNIRISSSGDATRVVFDLTAAVSERVFALDNPDRIVIDIADAQFDPSLASFQPQGLIKELRAADQGNGVLRVVLDVKQRVQSRSFSIPPADGMGHRLVVDLSTSATTTTTATATAAARAAPTSAPAAPVKTLTQTGRELVIAIDAGHGGQDPGAIGRKGTREKDITLAVARKLKQRIDAEPGLRAVLIRDDDTFIPLRERIVRAHKHKADLFISVHADAVHDRKVSGSSVYVLSAGRASDEAARMLADRENAADLVGGVPLDGKNDVLASVLLDLSQGASMSASIAAANKVLQQLDRVGPVLSARVKHASLKVLTSPDMPSMLVETAFISNPHEETKLRDATHQKRLADAIAAGVRGYFYDNPPPGTYVAQLAARERAAGRERGGATVSVMAGGTAN
jgi:N-acetylmuramoyl-L-alanine amidase